MSLKTEIVEDIINWAKACNINRVILFGSRARGDNKERSDIDLAVSGGNISAFSVGIDEEIRTLLNFDVVNLDADMQKELRDAINEEGVLLYEKVGKF